MSLSVRELDRTDVLALLSSEFGCPMLLPAVRAALIADHIRSLLWAPLLRARSEYPAEPLHTDRMFAALERNTRFLFSATSDVSSRATIQRDEFAFVCKQLQRCGEIFHLGDGYWIPGPLRLVRGGGAPAVIILGGAPTSALSPLLNGHPRSVGPARYFACPRATITAYPEESPKDWIGMVEPLASWTEKILSWATSKLKEQAGIEDESLEVYAPDVLRIRRRSGAWVEAKEFQEASPTLRLFRPKMPSGRTYDRPDYLGIFSHRSGVAQVLRAARIPKDTAYRLRFGFDQKLGTPRKINLRRAVNAYCLDLKFGLPEPEVRVLGLGWRDLATEPHLLFFDELALPVLEEVVNMLGVGLVRS